MEDLSQELPLQSGILPASNMPCCSKEKDANSIPQSENVMQPKYAHTHKVNILLHSQIHQNTIQQKIMHSGIATIIYEDKHH